MRSGKKAKIGLISRFGLKSDFHRFSGMLNPNLSSFFVTGSSTQGVSAHAKWKKAKIGLQSRFGAKIQLLQVFGHAESEYELHFETRS